MVLRWPAGVQWKWSVVFADGPLKGFGLVFTPSHGIGNALLGLLGGDGWTAAHAMLDSRRGWHDRQSLHRSAGESRSGTRKIAIPFPFRSQGDEDARQKQKLGRLAHRHRHRHASPTPLLHWFPWLLTLLGAGAATATATDWESCQRRRQTSW